MKALSEVAREALELSPVQRFALARILLDLSEEDVEYTPEVETLWDEEIGRRLAAVREGRATSRSLDDALEDLDRRFAP